MPLLSCFREKVTGARLLPVMAFAFFAWLNRGAFALGYWDEDFQWLHRMEYSGFVAALAPTAGDFYRPLSVNIPYFVFARLAHGLLLWKLFSLALTGVAYAALGDWLARRSHSASAGMALATLWLFHPAVAYGLYYPNAFDYVLFPALLVFLLDALERARWRWALAWLALACLSKEMALAFPLLFFLHRSRMPRRYLALALAVPGAVLLAHPGFTAGRAGGFGLARTAAEIGANALYLGRYIFFSPVSPAWHLLAWVAWAGGAAIAARRAGARGFVRAQACLVPAAVFFLPLPFLRHLLSRELGPIFWVFLFGAAADGWRHAGRKSWRVAAAVGCLAAAASAASPMLRNYYVETAEREAGFLRQAEEKLADCGFGDDVVVSGLERVTRRPDAAEWLAWGLLRNFRSARFYLLQLNPAYESEHYPLLWVSEMQAQGHPRFAVSEVEGRILVAAPVPPCTGRERERRLLAPGP